MAKEKPHVRLIDASDEAGRTTASLFSSLAGRMVALHYTSGVSVIGSTLAGLAEAGREISKTSDGARMRRAIAASVAKNNGELIWKALRISSWSEGIPATPVLDHVRNDLALLLAHDLTDTLENVPAPQESRMNTVSRELVDINFLDTVMGLWIYSREVVSSIEALQATAAAAERIEPGDALHNGSILR